MFHGLTVITLLWPAPECLAPLIRIDFFKFASHHLRTKQKISRSENEVGICPAQYEKAMEIVSQDFLTTAWSEAVEWPVFGQ